MSYLDIRALPTPPEAFGPQSSSPTGVALRGYGLAVVTTAASVALTRFTWPFFAGAPFAPLFAAVAMTSHFGGGWAGLLAIVLVVAGASLAFPSHGPVPWVPQTLIGFVPVALIGSYISAGRNRAVTALRESEAQLRATWEHATLGAALLNRFGHVERINPALERLLGYAGTPAASLSFGDFSHPDDADGDRQRFADFLAGSDGFYQREQRFRRKDGTLLWGRVTVSAITGANGRRTGALAVLEDVTAQRQAGIDLRASEERLRRAQKMEAVGQLVAGSPTTNNLLTVTMGYANILLVAIATRRSTRTARDSAGDRPRRRWPPAAGLRPRHDARLADRSQSHRRRPARDAGGCPRDIALTIDVADARRR